MFTWWFGKLQWKINWALIEKIVKRHQDCISPIRKHDHLFLISGPVGSISVDVDNDRGTKTVVEYKVNEEGKKVKVCFWFVNNISSFQNFSLVEKTFILWMLTVFQYCLSYVHRLQEYSRLSIGKSPSRSLAGRWITNI